MARILAIESSCDETAAAVVDDRDHVLSSVIASQVDIHRAYGGVVPELAARQHVEAIGPVVRCALDEAGAGFDSLDAVAVTQGPGLIGSLLVGVCAAKAIAWRHDLPLVAVNHLEGHIRSPFIDQPGIEFPALALIVSGGHTSLYVCPKEGEYRSIARTRDDAAGEAFDKVAKLLGLGYPGGPVIERLAQGADESAHAFPHARMKDGSLDFSFSGLKTAVRRRATERGLVHPEATGGEVSTEVRDLAASFQRAVVRVLVRRSLTACKRERVRSLLVTGGVSCNKRLRDAFRRSCEREGFALHIAAPRYTTDNAAMIAAAAFLHYERGAFAPLSINAYANFPL
ncbi:MAG: tRNA (adenosine(37)-N6)-threonylcarbamoyltransferase complex transferase subunit TsaD [Acidobacteria bacterium]|nr:tRNA (adenosine(37)-N6)-threonylcarbamoyltransferase complex transferase subunit TsaD [Acidobacteriota bacterium]